MKKIIAMILVVATMLTCAFSLTSCGKTKDLKAIEKAGKIVIGVTIYKPMDYLDEKDEWVGFDAELAQMFAKELGVNCQFVIIKWNNKHIELNSNQIDLIWNGMTAKDDLKEHMDFSVSYAMNAQVAVVKKNSGLSASNVKNHTVAVENGSAGETVAKDTVKATKINEVNAMLDALTEVKSGNSQVAIVDITMARNIVGQGEFADLEILDGATYGKEVFAVGLRKDSDLKEKLDDFLKAKYKDGTMEKLAKKYNVTLNDEALSK